MAGYKEIAALIASRVVLRNDWVGGVIVADLSLNNGQQMVSVLTGGATRTAIYLAPIALQVPGNCFVCRADNALTAPLIVPASNYQVPVTGFGWGDNWGDNWGG